MSVRACSMCGSGGCPLHERPTLDLTTREPEGQKHDAGKLLWDLVPLGAMEWVIKVLMYGAQKYGEYNWTRVSDSKRRYYNAALRHLVAWKLGEKNDPESGLPHLAHCACSLLFLLELDK